jgi:hypothetical protein
VIAGALLLALLSGLGQEQQGSGGPPPAGPPAGEPAPAAPAAPAISPEARAAWDTVVAHMTVPGERQPVTSFELRAHVTARQGVQSNDFEANYRFLEPSFIRFGLGASRETGRGPGKGGKAYWLRDKDQVTGLDGREYDADRKLVQRMSTIASNLLALSDPSKIHTQSLELRPAPPPGLPPELARVRRDWIELLSPDFDLYRDEPPAGRDPAQPRLFRVQLGADRKNHLPALVVLREEGQPGQVTGEPLLFELLDYRGVDGYLLPHGIRVWSLDASSPAQAFQGAPGQEISVLYADLTPSLKPDDFKPQ